MAISISTALHSDQNLIGYRIAGTAVHPIEIRTGDASPDAKPFGLLVAKGGTVTIPGLGEVVIDEPGLYRVHSFKHDQALQWIVHDDDIFLLAGSCSSVFYHLANEPKHGGENVDVRHKHLQYAIDNAVRGKVAGVCLTAANFFAVVCRWLGLKSVVWELDNLSTDLAPFNTHAMTEVFIDSLGQPVLFDVDRGFSFHTPDGAPLSLIDFVDRSRAGEPVATQPLNKKPYGGYGPGSRIPIAYDFIVDLYQLGGAPVDEDFYRVLGQAEVIIGTRSYGDADSVTTPVGRDLARQALADTTLSKSDGTRAILEWIPTLPDSDLVPGMAA